MILLESSLESFGMCILALAGVFGMWLLLGIIMQATSQISGKTFVHRGKVLTAPIKSPKNEPTKEQKAEMNAVIAIVEKHYCDPIMPKPKVMVNYGTGIVLTKMVPPHIAKATEDARLGVYKGKSTEEVRLQFMNLLIEFGLSKEAALKKAIEKYPPGS